MAKTASTAQRKASPPSDQDLDQLTSLFRLLSDKTRLQILMFLAAKDTNVTQLCEALNLPQPTVSHHLGLLRMSNLVGHRRDGKQVIYGLDGKAGVQKDSILDLPVQRLLVRIKRRATR
jgi:DNA-binding transcriptional ArsR family regulator